MTITTRRTLITAMLGATIALPMGGSAAAAAPATPGDAPGGTVTTTVGRLIMEPTARGYRADLPVTVTNNGTTPVHRVLVTEPVPGSWRGPVGDEFCQVALPKTYLRTIDCAVSVDPGQSYAFSHRFEVLTRTRPYAMSATGGQVAVHEGYGTPAVSTAGYRTVFRSTTGTLRSPRPYAPARRSDASITAGAAALARQADGSYEGWLPVTVRYRNDAPHTQVSVRSTVPAGVDIVATDPDEGPAFADGFRVPGGLFMQGETRTFRVKLTAPAATAPGDLGTATFELTVGYENDDVADRRPADNTVTIPIRLVDAG